MAIQTTAASGPYYGLSSSLPNQDGPVSAMIWVKGVQGCYICNASTGGNAWALVVLTTTLNFRDNNSHAGSAVLDSNWHSVAFTCAATTQTVSTYFDGVVDINAGFAKYTLYTPTDFRIGLSKQGWGLDSGVAFYGAKVWNAELTAGQIATEAASYSPVLLTGLYGSWLLTTAGATIADDSGNGHTLTQGTANWTTVSDPPPLGGGAAGFMWLHL